MTKKIILNAITRKDDEKNPKEIRNAGFVPGVVYGQGEESIQVKVNHIELEKVFATAGESSLVDLVVDEKDTIKVIIKSVDFENVKDAMVHVDFYKVDMKAQIEVEVPFDFIGESRAEKEGAVILKNMETVNVKCLPGELLESVEIDLAKLEKIGDLIRISDLTLPESFDVLSAEDDVIVGAQEPRIQAEEETPAEGADAEAAEGAEGAEEKKAEEAKKE